jgi:hypothetical protein
VKEPPAKFPVDPDPLAHGNLPSKFHVTIAPFRMIGKGNLCLKEERLDTLAGIHPRCRVFGFLFHTGGFTGF